MTENERLARMEITIEHQAAAMSEMRRTYEVRTAKMQEEIDELKATKGNIAWKIIGWQAAAIFALMGIALYDVKQKLFPK